jgi:hypothetical protein
MSDTVRPSAPIITAWLSNSITVTNMLRSGSRCAPSSLCSTAYSQPPHCSANLNSVRAMAPGVDRNSSSGPAAAAGAGASCVTGRREAAAAAAAAAAAVADLA